MGVLVLLWCLAACMGACTLVQVVSQCQSILSVACASSGTACTVATTGVGQHDAAMQLAADSHIAILMSTLVSHLGTSLQFFVIAGLQVCSRL